MLWLAVVALVLTPMAMIDGWVHAMCVRVLFMLVQQSAGGNSSYYDADAQNSAANTIPDISDSVSDSQVCCVWRATNLHRIF